MLSWVVCLAEEQRWESRAALRGQGLNLNSISSPAGVRSGGFL